MAKLKAIRSKVTLNGELMFPNDYLAAVEFGGKDVTLTISAVSKESLQKTDGKNKPEMVVRFERTTKKFVCNKTNASTIAGIYGTKAEEWVGKRITLYPTRCLAFGEMVDCLRVRETAPPAARAPAPAEPPPTLPPDDPPFPVDGIIADMDQRRGGEEDGQLLVGGGANSGGMTRAKPQS